MILQEMFKANTLKMSQDHNDQLNFIFYNYFLDRLSTSKDKENN